MLYAIPDEEPPDIDTSRQAIESGGVSATASPATMWQSVRKAGLLEVGEELRMRYGPLGQPKREFAAVVAEEGVELDGKTYSPSYAALACMHSVGSTRISANGWRHWRKTDGTLIADLWARVTDRQDSD